MSIIGAKLQIKIHRDTEGNFFYLTPTLSGFEIFSDATLRLKSSEIG